MRITTDWVSPASQRKGLDHLAVQAPCTTLYAQLIPGITNVTDRARYYSFYPWLLWSFDKRRTTSRLSVEQVVRRGECLFTLIAEQHTRKLGEYASLHVQALVGRNTLEPKLSKLALGTPLQLSQLAAPRKENPDSYFANPMGGLAQYYLGPMRDLGVLAGDRNRVSYTHERGAPLAEALDATVDADHFHRILEAGSVTVDDLDALASFCPCALPRNIPEWEALMDLFFDRRGWYREEGRWRRNSLALLLLVLSHHAPRSAQVRGTEDTFRAAVYAGAIEPGTPWMLPAGLETTRRGWAVYQRNELFSMALQSIFWIALRLVEEQEKQRVRSSVEVGCLVRTLAARALGSRGQSTFQEAVARALNELPSLTHWQAASHEVQRAWAVRDLAERKDAPLDEVLRAAVDILVALAARDDGAEPYRDFALPDDYFRDYPLNLRDFRKVAHGTWKSMALMDLCEWLATRWGIDVHLRVALRKLHHESLDTFRIRPTEEGLQLSGDLDDIPLPVFTSPRLRTSQRMLVDLGLLKEDGFIGGGGQLTPAGQMILEAIDG